MSKKLYSFFILLTAFLWLGSGTMWGAQSLPYSYGFEDFNLATDGWTTQNPSGYNSGEFGIVGAAKKTGYYGFRFSAYSGKVDNTQYLISPELDAAAGLDLTFYYKASNSYGTEKFKVGYSTTDADVASFTWGEENSTNSTSWLKFEGSFPAGTKYVAIYYYSNYQYRLFVDDFEFVGKASGPALQVLDGTTKLTSGHIYNFGLATAGTLKMFTMNNPGTEAAPITVSHTGSFTVTPSTVSIPAGEGTVLAIYMPDATGSDVITISSTAESIEDFVINVSGTVRDPSKFFESLLGGSKPEDWTTSGGTWSWNTTNGASNTAWYESSNYRLITPQLTVATGEQFFVEVQGTYDGYQGLKFEYSADGTTWTSSATVPTITGEWQTLSFNDIPAGKYYIALHGWHVYVRNFYGGVLPSKPKDIILNSRTSSSLTLSWTPAGSETAWKLQHSTDGTNWSEEIAAATNPFELTGLNAGTKYYVRVRADIASSEWSNVADFRTGCGAITALPYAENFEGHELNDKPTCWELLNAQSASTSTYPFIAVYTQSGYYKDAKALFLRTKSGYVGYAIFPEISASLASAQIAFTHKEENGVGTLVLGYLTNIADASTFVALYTCTSSSGWTDEEGISLATVPSGARLAFEHTVSNTYYYDAAVDNITISAAPSCPKPTGLGYSEKAAHSVKLSWTSAASAWKVEYAENSSFTGSTTVAATTNPYVLSGLDANTHYYVRVLTDCGAGSESEPTAAVDFTTKCEDATLPLTEGFEGGALPDCWSESAQWAIYNYSGAGHESNVAMRYTSSAAGDLTLRDIYLDEDAQISFWRQSSYVSCGVYINDGNGLTQLGDNFAKISSWKKDSVDLSAYTGKTVTLVIRGNYYNGSRYLYIDDIAVTYKPVATPTDLAAEATADGANVTWNSTEGTSWNLQYREKDAEPEAAWIAVNGLTAKSHTLTGLSTEKTYEVQVQAVCSANRKSAWTASTTFSPETCPTVTAVTLSNKMYNSVTVNCTLSGAGTWDLQYKENEGAWTTAYADIATASQAFAVSVGTTYSFRVKPSCGSDWTVAGETYAPVYPTPENVLVAVTEVTADPSWEKVVGATGYEYILVAKDAAQDWTSPSTATTADETHVYATPYAGLIGGTSYDFYVRAVFATGTGDASKKSFTTTKLAPNTLVKTASTTNSISFTWSYAGSVNQFQWKTSKAGSEWSAVQSETSATASDLESGTSYTIYVRTYYDDGIYSDILSGIMETECATKNLPIQENFTSGLPTCWETTTSKWSAGYFGGDGSECMAFDAKSHSNIGTLTTMGVVIPADVKAELTFTYRNIYGSSKTLIASQVNILDDADNVLDNTSNVLSKSTDAGTTAKVNLEAYAGQTIKIQFQVTGVGSVSGTAKFYIDDVEIQEKPCPQLQNLAAVPTPDGATISWEQGEDENRYQYCVVDEGEAADGWILLDENEFNVTISGKTSGTYDCYVRSYCSATSQSAPLMVQFTPSCVAPTALTISAVTDESATLSWTSNAGKLRYIVKGNTGDSTYVTLAPAATSYDFSSLAGSTTYAVQVQAACASNGAELWSDEFEFTTKCAMRDAAELPLNEDFSAGTKPSCWEFISTTEYPTISSEMIWFQGENEQIVVLPGYDIELNKLSIKFDNTAHYASIELGYLTTIGGVFNSLGAVTSGEEIDLATTSAPASAGYLAIRYFNTTSEFATGSVDNVVLRKTPSCFKPTAVAGAPGVGSASISWTENGSADVWNLQYKTGSADWTTVAAVTENPFALGGLEQGITYKVRVQAACAGEDPSDWSDEAEFTTNCEDVAALPFIETFDAALSNCWDITDEETTWYAPSVYGGELRLPGGKAASGHLVKLPNITADLTNAAMTIEYKATTGANTAVPQVGYIDELGDFQELATLDKSNTTTEARVELATANGKRLALRYDDGLSEGDFDIAEIRILEQLTLADNVDNTATLSQFNGQTVDVTIGRTFVCADYFNTICLPFSLSAAELAASPIASNDLWAFKYARVEGGELLIRIVEAESINAGEPYLISWPAGENIENPLFKNVTISASAGKAMGDENLKFVGILKPESFAAHDDTKLFLYQNNTLYWWNGDDASSLKSFRAFFTVEGGAGSMPIKNLPARIIKEDEEEQENTAIDNTKVDAQAFKFIENDQVVIIRNGVKYNIHGQVIEK